jgi:hypothetical protein
VVREFTIGLSRGCVSDKMVFQKQVVGVCVQ